MTLILDQFFDDLQQHPVSNIPLKHQKLNESSHNVLLTVNGPIVLLSSAASAVLVVLYHDLLLLLLAERLQVDVILCRRKEVQNLILVRVKNILHSVCFMTDYKGRYQNSERIYGTFEINLKRFMGHKIL